MCGVAGIIDYQGRENSRNAVNQCFLDCLPGLMSASAICRKCRLSIIDLVSSQQPLSILLADTGLFTTDVQLQRLRRRKEAAGSKHNPIRKSKIAVICQEDRNLLLNEQFVFAVWDKLKEELL